MDYFKEIFLSTYYTFESNIVIYFSQFFCIHFSNFYNFLSVKNHQFKDLFYRQIKFLNIIFFDPFIYCCAGLIQAKYIIIPLPKYIAALFFYNDNLFFFQNLREKIMQ